MKTILSKIMSFKIVISILLIITMSVLFGNLIPIHIQAIFFTISHLIRKVLMFSMPFLIFPFMATSIAQIKSKSTYLIVGIFVFVILSNFSSMMIAYVVGTRAIPLLGIEKVRHLDAQELFPLVDIALEPIVSIETTMLIACIVGLILSYRNNTRIFRGLSQYTALASAFFQKILIPILPLYVLGAILKAEHELDFATLIPSFGAMIVMIIITQSTYITSLFLVATRFNIHATWSAMKHAIPAYIVGLSTMSSVVTMPITMRAAEHNTGNPTIARIAISSTVNCHDIGECISLNMIALTIFYMTFAHMPDFEAYATFAFFATIAQFSGVGVPGGSIVVLLPLLNEYLRFNSDMSSLIIALSILMDPIGTANNVMGNSVFAMLINNLYNKINKLITIIQIYTGDSRCKKSH